jgi:hypothetical protein
MKHILMGGAVGFSLMAGFCAWVWHDSQKWTII